ncbi:MAG: cellulase family glycosylhydrolase [Cytophagaceae bacterium]|jgi:mannan endo-1,4-beta-mannosidase|nr:cellulase family glycosylhydrolase [Cytophagaceae bacterium]
MKKYLAGFLLLGILFSCKKAEETNTFVQVKEGKFFRGGKPYYFMGANYWCGMNLGSAGQAGNRDRLIRELDQMQQMGITNLRIMGLTEGPDNSPYRILPAVQDTPGVFNEEILVGLDFFLNEMKKRNMTAVVVLNNFWPWSGGMGQYLLWNGADSIPYPPPHPNGDWDKYQKFTAQFYSNKKAVEQYNFAVLKLLKRKNTISGVDYVEDPTIMSWELCNEPRGINNTEVFNQWIDSSAAMIKAVAPKQLVTVGSEGYTHVPDYSGTDFMLNHDGPNVDYTTVHIWIQNWNWYDPAKHDSTYASAKEKVLKYLKDHAVAAKKLGKPYVLEEFGIMRDSGNFDPAATTKNRDDYYAYVFEEVYKLSQTGDACGVNFWAYGGEGRPASLASYWKKGDDFTGDPPHEPQGWYSVNNNDTSTIKVISTYAAKFNAMNK